MESPLLPGVIFIALQLFQELGHADSSPSSAKRPIKAPREVFLRKLIEHVLLKIKKNKKTNTTPTTLLYRQILQNTENPEGKMLGTGSAGNII